MTLARNTLVMFLLSLGLAWACPAQFDLGLRGNYEDDDYNGVFRDFDQRDYGYESEAFFDPLRSPYVPDRLWDDYDTGIVSDVRFDDYGAYDTRYDWRTDDERFDTWYGDSDLGW